MKTFIRALVLSLSFLVPSLAQALITGGEGNQPVPNMGWPEGSEKVANLKTRIAMWEGPPFGGGQSHFEFRGKSTADFNDAMELFAKIEAPKKELIVQSGPKNSFWLGIRAKEDKGTKPRMDWSFVVWNTDSWNRLFNDPNETFLSDSPNFRKKVSPPQLVLYVGGGTVVWEDVVVPEGITVTDRRAKDGLGPSVRGGIRDIKSGAPIAGVSVTLIPGTQKIEGELPAVITGADGRYELKDFPDGTYSVLASKEGYATKRSLDFFEAMGTDVREEEFALSKAVAISGALRGPEDQALAGARVIATNVIGTDGFGYRADDPVETRSDKDGEFTLGGLPEGECRLLVRVEGYYAPGSVKTKYRLPGDEPFVINMIGTGTIRGTLKRSGKGQLNVQLHPPGGNKVGSWGGSMNCQPDGSFEFKNVPGGEYLIGPSGGPDDMKEGEPGVQKITVKAGEVTTLVIED